MDDEGRVFVFYTLFPLSAVPEKDNGEDFDDCPLVVVPDDVSDGLQRVQEPHEGGVRPTEVNSNITIQF